MDDRNMFIVQATDENYIQIKRLDKLPTFFQKILN